MAYTDITIVPVSVDRKDDYIAFSQRMAEVYRDHGAIRITDYWQVEDAGDQDPSFMLMTCRTARARCLTSPRSSVPPGPKRLL